MLIKRGLELLGALIFFISLYLAFILRYTHFYEFLLIGLFLMLYVLIPTKLLDNKLYLILYILFIFGGIIADLFLGLIITKLWYYNYNSIFEYIFLYLVVYPIGGIVMIQSYLLFKEKLGNNLKQKRYKNKILIPFIWVFLLFSLLFIILKIIFNFSNSGTMFSISLTLFVFFYINYKSEKLEHVSYIGDLISNFKLILVITLLSSYLNAFLHEFPNSVAKQWVYTNWLFNNINLLNISAVVFLTGWVALTIIPVSFYYYAIGLKKYGLKFCLSKLI